MGAIKIITDQELEDWYNSEKLITSEDIYRIIEEIIKLRKFTKKLIEQREEMYGKLNYAISTILFDSIRNEVDIKAT